MPDTPADQKALEGPEWRAAVAMGIDMSLVELNLQKTPWERMLAHDEALEFAQELRKAGAKLTTTGQSKDHQKS